MTKLKVKSYQQLYSRIKRQVFSHPKLVRLVIILVVVALGSWGLYITLGSKLNLFGLFRTSRTMAESFVDPTSILAQTNGRTNIAILGIGGASHEAPDLTDAMILVSIDLKSNNVLLLPLPRDIWIASLRAKLNTAYHYGEISQPDGGGFILTKAAISEVTDLPIHYAVLVDFNGFEKLIDLLGGLDLDVERAFVDDRYPIPGKENAEPESARYEQIKFEAGWQHMDGATALKYVRSRNAQGIEGTDLARSERQKKVLLAIKDRLLTTKVMFNRAKLEELKATLGEAIKTDIDASLYPAFARLALNFKQENITSAHLPIYLETDNGNSASESALLIHPSISDRYDDQWVLEPKTGDFQQIQSYVRCLLNRGGDCIAMVTNTDQ